MKKILLLSAVILMAAISFNSCKPSDEKIQKEVVTALSAIPGVEAQVKDGVATITGLVTDEASKAAAEAAVAALKNVKSVTNNIEVEVIPVVNQDDVLSALIQTVITAGGDAYKNVKAAVVDGEVTLTGDIARDKLQDLIQAINEASPKKVINELTIK